MSRFSLPNTTSIQQIRNASLAHDVHFSIDGLDMEQITDTGNPFDQHAHCLYQTRVLLQLCLPTAISLCEEKRLHVAKILRMTMQSMKEVYPIYIFYTYIKSL